MSAFVKPSDMLRVDAAAELFRRYIASTDQLDAIRLHRLYRAIIVEDFRPLLTAGGPLGVVDEEDEGYAVEIRRRIAHLDAANKDPAAELEKCRADWHYWASHWLWMIDPRRSGLRDCPIVLWPIQHEIAAWVLDAYAAKESRMIKKSRDMGFSVLMVGIATWLWLYRPSTIIGFGSRKQTLVHKLWDVDSLLEKVRYVLHHLPHWMLPPGYDEDKHFNSMNIRNPNGSQIKGESGYDIGRGGRTSIFFADEFSRLEHQPAAHKALTGNTDCCVYFGTSAGTRTYFYEMEVRGALPCKVVPWYHDPRKIDDPAEVGDPKAASAWRDAKAKEMNAVSFAQEYACDDLHSETNTVIPVEWIEAATRLRTERAAPIVAGLDPSEEGADEAVLVIRAGPVIICQQSWPKTTLRELAADTHRLCQLHDVKYLYYDSSGLGQGFEGPIQRLRPMYTVQGINQQQRPTETIYRDDPERNARERFGDISTELWWALRLKLHASWEHVEGYETHQPEQMLALPDDPVMTRQLASRTWRLDAQGRIVLTSKRHLSSSPDRADALAQAEFVRRPDYTPRIATPRIHKRRSLIR